METGHWPKRGEKCGIYAIENTSNGKVYIGQAKDIYKRWHSHLTAFRRGKNARKLMNAWSKYGEASFRFFIVEECNVSELNAREQAWIDTFDAVGSGYNVCPTAGSQRGLKHTDERRNKAANGVRRKWTDPEFRKRAVASATAARQADEYRAQQGERATRQWSTESREKMVAGLTSARRARSPVTPEMVEQVKARYVFRCPSNGTVGLARQFGVAPSVISNIINGKTWT